MAEISIAEYTDKETVQDLQDGLAGMMGIAALITDDLGNIITTPSNFGEFCQCVKNSPNGPALCDKCTREWAQAAIRTGEIQNYVCHAGIIGYCVPVMAGNHVVGTIAGEESFAEMPDRSIIETLAKKFGVSADELWAAANMMPVWDESKHKKTIGVIIKMAEVMSKIMVGNYHILKAAEEMEKAASFRSDFLANMSHEIRTPMNAVIGMAEMALREDLTPAARDYITQIKVSGKSLLNIINDILDFSKIDSGNMEIIPAEYEPLSLINDVGNLLATRVKDKDIQLLMEINPNFPSLLMGDCQRIRQVLINLANNAIKFTKRGFVKIKMDYEPISDDEILVKVAVEDSGIGIKQEDLSKIFQSFQQVDSKRNRNVEGTGLGLAISQKLIQAMGGSVKVESEYEKGSVFSFEIPQKVIQMSPVLNVQKADNTAIIGYLRNKYVARQFYSDSLKLGVYSMALTKLPLYEKMLVRNSEILMGKKIYMFFEEEEYSPELGLLIDMNPDVQFIELAGFYSDTKSDKPNLRVMHKPYSTILQTMAMNDEEFHGDSADAEAFEFDFVAPTAKVLIVDDNAINLTVAEGLLQPLEMKIYTATGGKMAIDMIGREKFDLIFMDHMMPEIDGVETTRIIRRLHKEYDEVPIIALTANAVEGTKEMFLSEGMNDFVAKPIEVRNLVTKVKQWLPVEKIERSSDIKTISDVRAESGGEVPPIGDLYVDDAIKMVGSSKLFMDILKDYYKAIPGKVKAISEYHEACDWPAYTIEVHALKSSSKQIGAMELSIMAAELEKAGNARDTEFINKYTAPTLEKYKSYIDVLAPLFEVEQTETVIKETASNEQILSELENMLEAIDNLDMDMMEEIAGNLSAFAYDETQSELMEQLCDAVERIDVDECDNIIARWKNELEG